MLIFVGTLLAGYSFAGELSADQIAINANLLKRDSGKNIIYLYNNNGTVNNSADDIPLAGTDSFSASNDVGYQLSGSKHLAGNWSINAGWLNSELSKTDNFTDPSMQLEIFRLPITNNFDSADSVSAAYSSKVQNLEINAVYRFSDNLDLFAGLAQVKLDEQFKIVSNDSLAAGAGTYTINTKNKMLGPQLGLAYAYKPAQNYQIYFVGKLAWLNNDSSQNQFVDDSPTYTRSGSASDSHSSMYYDLKLGLKYRITQQLAINLAYQYINVSDVALAESQFDTSASGSNTIKYGDSVSWSGASLGVGYYF